MITYVETSALLSMLNWEADGPGVLELDEAVRLSDRSYPVEPIRTMDALRIESAAIIARFAPVKMIALDKRVRENAAAMDW